MALRRVEHRGGERGAALIELMVSAVILLIVVTGFVGAVREAVSATAVAHRRTEATLLRTGLLEKLAVAPRAAIESIQDGAWRVESCYDKDARLTGENTAWAADYACPDGTAYRRSLAVVAAAAVGGIAQRSWTVQLIVDRADSTCDATTRYTSISCVGADILITD